MRTERDSLGERGIPDDVYYGIQTDRAIENFPVSGIKADRNFINAYVRLKKACALTNMELGDLDEQRGRAIVKAADLVLDGDHYEQFQVDVFQAGAGTSFNMNVNEVLANLALEELNRAKGDYGFLSPNDHVNMSQSTNDTFPTASHMAALSAGDGVAFAVKNLAQAFRKKGEEFKGVAKSGRTHLMDAVPLSLGSEFKAYAMALDKAVTRIDERTYNLMELPIGGTAVGAGTNADRGFRSAVIEQLSQMDNRQYRHAVNSYEALQSRAALGGLSGALKELALDLTRIANDLRLLGAGPVTGACEIELPAVQPGSSIMPGKVNPVMAECLNMVCFQIIGADTTVSMAVQAGQFDLNVFTPVIIHNVLNSCNMLNNYLPIFQVKCVEGIIANKEVCSSYINLNPSLATLLNPKIGYLKAAELAKEAMLQGISVKDLAVQKGILSQEAADALFDEKKIAEGLYDDRQ